MYLIGTSACMATEHIELLEHPERNTSLLSSTTLAHSKLQRRAISHIV
jgi:hypothetical protein